MSGLRDRLGRVGADVRAATLRRLFRLGWRGAHRVPAPVVAAALTVAARTAVWRPGRHVLTLRRNLTLLTGRSVDDRLLRAAVRSHLRNVYEMLALPGWRAEKVLARIETVNEPQMRAAYASTGAVVVLPHSGNWDLAGAYAQLTAMPVTTVAEALPDADFAAFVAFRERLGMQVLSHRDPAVVGELLGAVRAGRLVCLLGDRDLAGSGVDVTFFGARARMPAGPALLAATTGAVLLPVGLWFTSDGWGQRIHPPLEPPPDGRLRDRVTATTQALADVFAADIAEHPEDWHMLQRLWLADPAAPGE
jgi:phosphatidylinositol dimannoside acyltransferase